MNISNKRKQRYKYIIVKGIGLFEQIKDSNKHIYKTEFTLKDFEDIFNILNDNIK